MNKKTLLITVGIIVVLVVAVGILQKAKILPSKECYAAGFQKIEDYNNGTGKIINGSDERCPVIWDYDFWLPI